MASYLSEFYNNCTLIFLFTGLVCQAIARMFNPAPANTYNVLSDSGQLFLNCTIDGLSNLQTTAWNTHVTGAIGRQISANSLVDDPFVDEFRIEGTYNLVFLTRALSYAGQYACQSTGAPVVTSYAEVIVLGELNNLHDFL